MNGSNIPYLWCMHSFVPLQCHFTKEKDDFNFEVPKNFSCLSYIQFYNDSEIKVQCRFWLVSNIKYYYYILVLSIDLPLIHCRWNQIKPKPEKFLPGTSNIQAVIFFFSKLHWNRTKLSINHKFGLFEWFIAKYWLRKAQNSPNPILPQKRWLTLSFYIYT